MHRTGVAAYAAAFLFSLLSILSLQRALSIPWLKTDTESITLSRRCVQGLCDEFPPRSYCFDHSSFCGGWRTCRFMLAITFILNVASLLVLVFSVMFQRRKKTVTVVRNLLMVSIMFQLITIVVFPLVVNSSELFQNQEWIWANGYYMVFASACWQLFLECEMLIFRALVKHPDELDFDSDVEDSFFDEDLDSVSIDDDVPEEERDFYLFNKQARRLALSRSG